MNVYTSWSIRGSKAVDVSLYAKTIEEAVVEAGHLLIMKGDSIERDPEISHDQFIYERDMNWIRRSDCLIAEVSNPSLGVGFEIATAIFRYVIPVLAVAVKDEPVSAMIGGCMDVYPYRDAADLKYRVRDWLEETEKLVKKYKG